MLKNKSYIVLSVIILSYMLNAQPYYYTSTYEPFQYGHHNTGNIYRINMYNPTEIESLMVDIYDLGSVIPDEYGNWLAYEESFRLTIMNLNNQTQKNIISQYSEGVIRCSYAEAVNSLIIQFLGNYPNPEKMVMVDPLTLNITDTVSSDILWDCNRNEDIILSNSGDIMYLLKTDTVQQKRFIASYSFLSKQIINSKYIEELSESQEDEFFFNFRRNGLSVIESLFLLPTPTSYYRIYFLDKDSLSIPVIRDDSQTWADGYVASEGDYLLLFNNLLNSDSLGLTYTGKIEIYDMKTGELEKIIQLPSGGEVMCFENYPNNVYYVKDIEEPTRQVWNLNMDSIFNVLDLTNLEPNTINVGANLFTLTINGKGFDTLSTVYFNGQPKTTTFISDSVLTAEILISDVAVAGSFPVWVTDRYSISDTLQFTVTQVSNPNLLVNLKNSLGNQIPASNVMYYEGSWKDAVNNGDGTFTVITTKPTVSIRMFYEYANQTVNNVSAQNNTYTFTTVNAAVQLKNSSGNLIDEGTVQYYAGAWRSFGTTVNGIAHKELLPVNYSFRMTYEYVSNDKQQNLSENPVVDFNTVLCTIKVTNANNQPLEGANTKYYSVAWRDIGLTNSNGEITKELLPKNLSFRATYNNVSQDKQQDISVNNLVEIMLNVP